MRVRIVGALGLAIVLAVACAPYPATSPTPVPAPPVGSGTPPSPLPDDVVTPPPVAQVDSMPSNEALEVLATIPEPLAPAERIPPPQVSADDESNDLGSEEPAEGDSAGGEIPIPTPTLRLGERAPTPPDSAATAPPPSSDAGSAAPSPPRSTPPPSAPPPTAPPSAPAGPDTCWRVQVAAPFEQDKAEALKEAASSLLLVPMTVEFEQRRHKVRTRDCLTRAAADRVRARAEESGFTGAFRFVTKR